MSCGSVMKMPRRSAGFRPAPSMKVQSFLSLSEIATWYPVLSITSGSFFGTKAGADVAYEPTAGHSLAPF